MYFAGLWAAVAIAAGPVPGVDVTGPLAVEAPCASGESTPVDVVTFNTWGLPFPIAHSRADRLPRIGRFLAESGYSVAGLQEVWKGARGLLGLEGLFLPKLAEGDSGLAMVSKWPVLETTIRYFDDAVGFDAWKRKGVLATKVDAGEAGPMWVLVTHLQAGASEKAAAVRGQQVDEILALLDGLDGPAVVMGDFNLYAKGRRDQATVDRLVDAGLLDVAEATGVTGATYRWEAERLDRIFVRSQDDGVCVLPEASELLDDGALGAVGSLLSDHIPLSARIRVVR